MGASVEQSATSVAPDGAAPPPPTVEIFQMYVSAVMTQMLEIVMEHQVPQRLMDGPRTSVELAEMAGVHEPSLYRVMRTLTSFGLFSEVSEGRFTLGRLGEAAAGFGGPYPWSVAAMNALPHAVRTGRAGMDIAHGVPFFEFLAQHPRDGAAFDAMMTTVNAGEKEAVAEAYDFSGVRTLVDVGGGNGTLMRIMLERYPDLRGAVFDVPPVIERATPAMEGFADRCRLISGDFFDAVPSGGDAYIMSHIIHDWDEERAIAILRRCREAMAPNARLLLVEMVIPPGDAPHPAKMLDMLMMVYTGGMERTEKQYAQLLDRAALRLERVIPTQSPVSVIEAVSTEQRA